MPVGAGIAGAAGLAGAYMSSQAAKSAAKTQADAANNAAAASMAQFNTINAQQAPYREAGYGALSNLQNYMGIVPTAPDQNADNFDAAAYLKANPDVANNPYWSKDPYSHYLQHGQSEGRAYTGTAQYQQQLDASKNAASQPGFGQFNHQFDANDLTANLAPNYQFMLDQGIGQNKNMANSTGGLLSGNTLQGLNTFTQNYAQNAYQQAYQNYNANQTNIFNRLSALAGLGQTANQSTANAGMNMTNSANNYLTSAAAANAAGTVGSANAISGGLTNAASLGALYGWSGGPASWQSGIGG